jgi:hypothetical protein
MTTFLTLFGHAWALAILLTIVLSISNYMHSSKPRQVPRSVTPYWVYRFRRWRIRFRRQWRQPGVFADMMLHIQESHS